MSTFAPCKRPKVTIEPFEKTFAATERTATYHRVTCHVPGCDFLYEAAVITDAKDQATWHRTRHREAVPNAFVSFAGNPLRHYAACLPCGVRTGEGVTNRADAQLWLDHHLVATHGLVKCS